MSYQQVPDNLNEKGNPPETPPQQQNQAPPNYSQFAPTAVPAQAGQQPVIVAAQQPQYVQQQQYVVS